ncbi:tetratricopeptide repeat protein [Salinimonas lutimaris]|uniref:tetratricopeptide repeat protein n=1 Tax=Salinimonas lutimaris TaxID=914153 RepID=UPI0015868214|nr:tetratricopeptide repeat protein [Salinimonas lutimaris]
MIKHTVIISTLLLTACSSTPDTAATAPAKAVAPLEQIKTMAGHYEQAGELDKALVYYLKALESDPNNTQLTYRVAELNKQMGKPELALHMLQRVIAQQPNHSTALSEAAMLLLEMKEVNKATAYFIRVTELDQARLTTSMMQAGSYKQLDAQSPVQAYNGLGVAYDLLGRYDDAKALYALCLERTPYSAMVLTNMGYSHYLSGDYALSVDTFHRAIDAEPAYTRSWTNLGLVYTRMGRYNKAFQTLRRVMDEAQAYNDLGYFLMLEQRYEEAEYFFEQAISTSPRYYEVAYENLNDVRQHISVIDEDSPRRLP